MKGKHPMRRAALILLAILFLLPCLLLVLPLAGRPPGSLWDTAASPAYLQGYRNTVALAAGSVVLQTAVALPAGYVLARNVSRRIRRICLVFCGLLILLPQQALLLPQYLILQTLGLLDTLAGLLLMTAFQPWMVLLFWFGTRRIDPALFDAAACDGAAGLAFVRRVYLPLLSPCLAVAALLSAAESWNLLEQPMTFLQQKSRWPLSLLLSRLPAAAPAGRLLAGLLLALPLAGLFALLCSRAGRDGPHRQ